jgi:glucose uptake protein
LLLGMACWGSWANAHRIARHWRFELFYWDYSFGMVVFALLAAMTLGAGYGEPTWWENLLAAERATWWLAATAGAVWNVGNILLVAAITLVGIAVAFPIAVGMALVLGAISSYLVMPRGNPVLLGAGVALVFVAVIVNSLAYRAAARDEKRSNSGLWLCVLAGLLITVPGPLVAKAFSAERALSAYGVMLLFTLGALATSAAMLPVVMRRPFNGQALHAGDYFQGTLRDHASGFVGAVVWAIGSMANFIGAEKVGVALAYSIGQANPLVAALWGVFVWKEFRGAPRRAHALLALMFLFYLAGLIVLARSG